MINKSVVTTISLPVEFDFGAMSDYNVLVNSDGNFTLSVTFSGDNIGRFKEGTISGTVLDNSDYSLVSINISDGSVTPLSPAGCEVPIAVNGNNLYIIQGNPGRLYTIQL
ncbi:MAG: hypothetical protein PF518_13275 [Spirochaetaceae bacterium]|jgi:hypothetical protein|nr:hypothetical protein [Spirochaetaceae bacterium]